MTKFVKLAENAIIPKRATAGSAGYDLHVLEDTEIPAGKTLLVGTGIGFEDVAHDTVAILSLRSSIALKRGLILANGIGVIDSDYRLEIKVMVHNIGEVPVTLQAGERIAQLLFTKYLMTENDGASVKEQRVGGFGSTG